MGTNPRCSTQDANGFGLVLIYCQRLRQEPRITVDLPPDYPNRTYGYIPQGRLGFHQGIGESGLSRRTWNAEIAGSNPATLTTTQTMGMTAGNAL
jgi:hypothetical protein